jgi:2-iminobutanoate/2-iminopropanoate deaminase
MKKIESNNAPKAIGPYSQATEAAGLIFVSGQIPIDPKTGKLVEANIEIQTRQVLANIEAILKEAGLGFQSVLKVEIYVKDISHFQIINGIYAEAFCHPIKPARQLMEVARLPLDSLIEISCIATSSYCQ